MRLSLVLFGTLLLLGSCTPEKSDHAQSTISVNAVLRAVTLSKQSLLHPSGRPAAILGVLATHHLARPFSPPALSDPSLIGILQQEKLLRGGIPEKRGAQTSLEELGGLIQINVPDLLNRNPNRADTLNAYINQMEQSISEANVQYTLLETFLDEVGKTFSIARRELSAEQKKQNKAMKDRQFAEASTIQERLLLLHRDLANVEFKKNEAERIQELLEEMIEVSQKRLTALQENREILIAGLSVKQLPGMDDLGIVKTTKKRGLFR